MKTIVASKTIDLKKTLDDFLQNIIKYCDKEPFKAKIEECDERFISDFQYDAEKFLDAYTGSERFKLMIEHNEKLIKKITSECVANCIGGLSAAFVFGIYKGKKNFYIYGGSLWNGFAAWTYGENRKFPIHPKWMETMLEINNNIAQYIFSKPGFSFQSARGMPRSIIPIKTEK